MTPAQFRTITEIKASPLAPELLLGTLPEGTTLEAFRTRHHHIIGPAVPYWAVPWPGGQGLARFLLDGPELATGRRVVDLGCGGGLIALAAARADAAEVLALDEDPNALIACAQNARANDLDITIHRTGLQALTVKPGDLICLGDLWYDQPTGRAATGALHRLSATGADVIFCDAGRSFRPRRDVETLAEYTLSHATEFEVGKTLILRVCRLSSTRIHPAHTPHVRRA